MGLGAQAQLQHLGDGLAGGGEGLVVHGADLLQILPGGGTLGSDLAGESCELQGVIGLVADVLYNQVQGIEKIHNAVPPSFSLGSGPGF